MYNVIIYSCVYIVYINNNYNNNYIKHVVSREL